MSAVRQITYNSPINKGESPMSIRNQIYGVAPSAHSPLVLTKKPTGAIADDLLSIAVNRMTGRCGDTRADERPLMVIEPAVVTWRRSKQPVHVINLCAGGAMISADFAPRLWDRVTLHFDDGRASDCTVAWLKDGRIGLEFASVQ